MKKEGTIKDACIVIAGQSPQGSSYNDVGKGMEFHQGKKAFGESIIEHSNVWTTEITKIAEPGDILMSVRAPVGPTNLTDRKICIGRGLAAIRCKSEIIPHYILYALRNIENKIVGNDGAVFNSINKKQIEDLPLPLLPLSEQQAIVSRLDAAFARIDALKANAEKQLDEARALFQKALSQAMEPKEGWEEKKIKDIAEVKGGKRVPKGYKLESVDTGHKYIRVSDFTDDGTIDLSNLLYISEEVYKQIKNYTITDKNVYLSIAGTIGKAGIIPSSLNGSNLTENACKLVFTKPVEKRFIYLYTKSDAFKKQIDKATKQASQPKLALTRLAEVIIYIPNIDIQQQIVSRLDSLSEHVRELEEIQRKTIAECDALKQAMLREVFE